jgi:hypothetical protein
MHNPTVWKACKGQGRPWRDRLGRRTAHPISATLAFIFPYNTCTDTHDILGRLAEIIWIRFRKAMKIQPDSSRRIVPSPSLKQNYLIDAYLLFNRQDKISPLVGNGHRSESRLFLTGRPRARANSDFKFPTRHLETEYMRSAIEPINHSMYM